ncbi:unnamed protein product [Amoebophrya sp. A25]|nr:unnamed protein product [Amoebophrya sp. A25]|eukprot:GSA25T00011799001.1
MAFIAVMSIGVLVWGADVIDAFFLWALSPEFRRLAGWSDFRTEDASEVCLLFLSMGLAISPGANDESLKACFAAIKRLFPWIGFIVDTVNLVIEVDEEKACAFVAAIREFLAAAKIDMAYAKDLASVVGKLGFTTLVVRMGHIFLREGYDTLGAAGVPKQWAAGSKRFSPKVKVSDKLTRDLLWWIDVLLDKPKIKIFQTPVTKKCFLFTPELIERTDVIEELDENQFTLLTGDASRLGWGMHVNGDQFRAAANFSLFDGAQASSNKRELGLVLEFLLAHPDKVADKLVLYRSDNSTTKHYVNFAVGRIPELSALGKKIAQEAARLRCVLICSHLKGATNIIADMLSRLTLNATLNDNYPHKWIRRRTRLALWARLGGSPSIDLCCNDKGSNAVLPRFVTYREDFFTWPVERYEGEVAWAHLTLDLLAPALKKYFCPMMQLSPESRPAVLILVPKYKSRLAYLYARFFRVAKLKAHTQPFSLWDNQEEFALPKAETPYLVLSTLPSDLLRARLQSLKKQT